MYAVVVAIMLAGASEPKLPVLVASYPTLNDCRMELLEVSKLPNYKLVVSPLLSYSVSKEVGGDITIAFCVKNIVSI
tara:strand:+ start:63 stop:293 length:231 start_codon:yes stop_codon:yes gene_type:complete